MEILLTLVLLAPVVWLLEHTHRRTRDLPRTPFGADAESEASSTYRRQLAELRELAQLMDDRPQMIDDRPAAPTMADARRATSTTLPADRGAKNRADATGSLPDCPLIAASAATRLQRTLGGSFAPLGGWAGTTTMVKPS